EHAVAEPREDGHREPPHRLFVFHEQQRLRAARQRRGGAERDRRLQRRVDAWKENPKRGPPPRLALELDLAPALLHEAVHRREPEARTLAHRLRGEERL